LKEKKKKEEGRLFKRENLNAWYDTTFKNKTRTKNKIGLAVVLFVCVLQGGKEKEKVETIK